jgi:hypothetical protein
MSQSAEAWNQVGEQFEKLGTMFQDHYQARSAKGEDVASRQDIEEAVHVLGESLKTAFGAFGDAVADPDLQDEARRTAGSIFEAFAATFSDLGAEVSGRAEGDDAS